MKPRRLLWPRVIHWEDLSRHEGAFFDMLHTTARTQVATMTIPPGEEAGDSETHEGEDQVIVVLKGEMLARVWGDDGKVEEVRGGAGHVLVVHAGRRHWVKSVGREPLFFATVYGPPAY